MRSQNRRFAGAQNSTALMFGITVVSGLTICPSARAGGAEPHGLGDEGDDDAVVMSARAAGRS